MNDPDKNVVSEQGLNTSLSNALKHARNGNVIEAHAEILTALGMVCSLGARKVECSLWSNTDGRVIVCFDDHRAPIADHFPGHYEPSLGVTCKCGWMNLGIVHLLAGPYLFMGRPSCSQRHPETIGETMIVWQGHAQRPGTDDTAGKGNLHG